MVQALESLSDGYYHQPVAQQVQLAEQVLLAELRMSDQEQLTRNDQGVEQNNRKIQVESPAVAEAKVLKLQPLGYYTIHADQLLTDWRSWQTDV